MPKCAICGLEKANVCLSDEDVDDLFKEIEKEAEIIIEEIIPVPPVPEIENDDRPRAQR